jgi:hypothetical protein
MLREYPEHVFNGLGSRMLDQVLKATGTKRIDPLFTQPPTIPAWQNIEAAFENGIAEADVKMAHLVSISNRGGRGLPCLILRRAGQSQNARQRQPFALGFTTPNRRPAGRSPAPYGN